MQHLWTCLLLAVTVRGTLASVEVTNEGLGGYLVVLTLNGDPQCTGTLLHERIVLTAGYCVTNRDVNLMRAIGGPTKLTDTKKEGSILKVVVIAPDADAAIILLDKPIVGKGVGKLSLCTTKLKDGMQLLLPGWGLSKNNAKDNILRSVKVPFMDWNKCRDIFRGLVKGPELFKNSICAGALKSNDACVYDYGGPLVHNKEVCGILTAAVGCNLSTNLSVYTDVLPLKSYIEKISGNLLAHFANK